MFSTPAQNELHEPTCDKLLGSVYQYFICDSSYSTIKLNLLT